jgi:cytochrome c-type biogenesis protein CcmH
MLWLALVLLLTSPSVLAADTPHSFSDPLAQARYEQLLEELRCLVCQNQSLADSHADLAQDLRDEVYRMVSNGQDNAAILRFMVDRYGDFVLYRPPFKAVTWGLWCGPLVLLTLVFLIWRRAQRRTDLTSAQPLSADERRRLQALMARDDHE